MWTLAIFIAYLHEFDECSSIASFCFVFLVAICRFHSFGVFNVLIPHAVRILYHIVTIVLFRLVDGALSLGHVMCSFGLALAL